MTLFFERRFQPIFVKEPTLEDSIKILDGIKTNYEIFIVLKLKKALWRQQCVCLTATLVINFLPDKAIDILDETAAAGAH